MRGNGVGPCCVQQHQRDKHHKSRAKKKTHDAISQAATSFAKDFERKHLPLEPPPAEEGAERGGRGDVGRWEVAQLEMLVRCLPVAGEAGRCTTAATEKNVETDADSGGADTSACLKKELGLRLPGIVHQWSAASLPLMASSFTDTVSGFTRLSSGGGCREVVPRWERLHMGLTEEKAFRLGVTVPEPSPREQLRQRMRFDVSKEELWNAAPPVTFNHCEFPAIVQRASSSPRGSHYEYFARRCPLQCPAKREAMKLRAAVGKITGLAPRSGGVDGSTPGESIMISLEDHSGNYWAARPGLQPPSKGEL